MSSDAIYPDFPTVKHTLHLGMYTKEELYQLLAEKSVKFNAYAEELFQDEKFILSDILSVIQTIEVKVKQLGYLEGATLPEIFKQAQLLELNLCPLEVGPLLRLAFLDQNEGDVNQTPRKNQAPAGAITVASPEISEDSNFPKGFYLRKINGELWLRGYVCDDLHVFQPDDTFVFCV